jgi:H+-translocating NAD(P) transhydrogenase subunit alpha
MSELTPEQAAEMAEAARQAAEAAQNAANVALDAALQAETIAGSLGAVVHGATGGAIDPFIFQFAIFVLAVFVGYYVVWSVTPALHTPLMSVTNAISSVIIVGALLAVSVSLVDAVSSGQWWARTFGFIAVVLASVNIFGGFLVTQRMLAMYKKKTK